jgi:very-short-patch-repair endonuclease
MHAMALTWPDATLYGVSALLYWEPDAPVRAGPAIHCAVPWSRGRKPGLIPHVTRVPDDAVATREGVRLQRRTPALVVALASLPPRDAQALLAWMVSRRKVDPEEFARAVEAHGARRGARSLRSYHKMVAAGVASPAEVAGRAILIARGLTGWETNALVRTRRGEAKSADFLFRGEKVIVMIDGWKYHGDRRAFQIDRQDQNGLVTNGYLVLRFTYQDVTRRQAYVADQVAQALDLRRALRG